MALFMLANQAALWAFTGRLEMSVFQTLSPGNMGHPGAPGTGVPACAVPAGPTRDRAALTVVSTATAITRAHRACPTSTTLLPPYRRFRPLRHP